MEGKPDIEFDPVRCAELQNRLLAKAISHIPGAVENITQDVLSTWLELSPEFPRHDIKEGSPLYTFLSLIHRYEPATIPLSSEFKQPIPAWFYNEWLKSAENDDVDGEDPDHEESDEEPDEDSNENFDEDSDEDTDEDSSVDFRGEEERFLLLYPQHDYQSPEFGLWIDIDTCLVIWAGWKDTFWPGCKSFPDPDDWVPLEFVLSKALNMWEIGKFHWGPEYSCTRENTVLLRSWIQADLDGAIKQWELLLQAIQERLPGLAQLPLQDPLPSEVIQHYKLGSFAKAFLCAARRPSFTYVGPGITTFTPNSFRRIYGAEIPNSRRLDHLDPDSDYYQPVSLLLPAVSGPAPEKEYEDGELGREGPLQNRQLVSQWTGLYLTATIGDHHGDSSTVVTLEGIDDVIRWKTPKPWGRHSGNVPLSAMLRTWTNLVKKGAWTVSSEGVSTDNRWFWDPTTEDDRRVAYSVEHY